MLITAGVFAISMFAVADLPLPRIVGRRSPARTYAATISARPPLPETILAVDAPPLDDASISSIVAWNRADGRPARIGVVKQIESISLQTASGKESAAIRVTAPNSDYVRVGVECSGGEMWITGSDGDVKSFSCTGAGTTWSPTVSGPDVIVQSLNGGRVTGVAEIISPAALSTVPSDNTACLLDVACLSQAPYSEFQYDRQAVAMIDFLVGSDVFVCSGGWLSDKADDGIPYFLTANHCVSSSAVASTVEAFWDYSASSCGGAAPNLSSLPRSVGATLLTTGVATDVTLLQLASVPNAANRSNLGWTARASDTSTAGTVLYRISYPGGLPQRYSTTTVDTIYGGCSGRSRPQFILSRPLAASTGEGSSGSPVFIFDGQHSYAAGQLLGQCEPLGADNCNPSNVTTDGSLVMSWALVQPYIWSDSTPAQPSCQQNSTTACVLNNRFQVRVRVHNHFANPQYDFDASVKPVTGFASTQSETAFFYFTDANNIELLVKLLNAGNSGIAVLYGVATPFELWLTITDTRSGAIQTYHTDRDAQNGRTQFGAFPLDVPSNHTDR